MNRSIGRFFLYLLYTTLLIFVASGAGWLLQLLLAFTPLRGSMSTPPATTDLARALVLWAVSWVLGLPLVIFFAHLIRRDYKSDPQAGSGGIRAFFFNAIEACIAPIAISVAAFSVLEQLGQSYRGDVTGATSFVVLSLALVAWLDRDRRKVRASSPAALVFQRVHLYGVQLLLLTMLTSTWLQVSRLVIDALVFNSQGAIAQGFPAACGGLTTCALGPNLLSLVVATFWIAGFWIGYGALARDDHSSRWYQVIFLATLAWGLGFILFGLERGIELILLLLNGINVTVGEISGPAAAYDFASPLLLGIIVSGVAWFWLRRAERKQAGLSSRLALWAEAIGTFLLAVAFWWGIGQLFFHVFEQMAGTSPDRRTWIGAISLVVVGIAFIPLVFHLQRRSLTQHITGPLRSLVLALLGGGILTSVIGASVTLYLEGTFLLGSPLNNWQQSAREGAAALIVGISVMGIFLWIAFHERAFAWFQKSKNGTELAAPPASTAAAIPEEQVSASPETYHEVEAVLNALLAGTITREQAATHILYATRKQREKSLSAS